MQSAATLLGVIQDRGSRGLPLERVYRQLFNRELYLQAFAFYNVGNASAVVVVFFIIILALALVLLHVREKTKWV